MNSMTSQAKIPKKNLIDEKDYVNSINCTLNTRNMRDILKRQTKKEWK